MTRKTLRGSALATAIALMAASNADASTLTQNLSWTIDRAGTTTKYRKVAYGDSMYAGYNGSLSNADRYAATTVDAEYLSALWNADVEDVRRMKSGAIASDIYNNKIVAERSYMQATNTRVVSFEMCGNDALQARNAVTSQVGTCNYSGLVNALNNCTTYMQSAMSYINATAYAGTKLKTVATIYYTGWNADNKLTNCTDATTGQRVNVRDMLLPYLAKINYRFCAYGQSYGFECVDQFAQFMGADYDRNGDGQIDSEGLAWQPSDTEASYVTRITSTLKGTILDANTHYESATASYDYLLSDDIHPTYSGPTQFLGLVGGSASGSSAPRYTSFAGGKSPIWNRYGHERMGWAISRFTPAAP